MPVGFYFPTRLVSPSLGMVSCLTTLLSYRAAPAFSTWRLGNQAVERAARAPRQEEEGREEVLQPGETPVEPLVNLLLRVNHLTPGGKGTEM